MKKVKFKKTTKRWFKNEVVELDDDAADAAVKAKDAVYVPAGKASDTLPSDAAGAGGLSSTTL